MTEKIIVFECLGCGETRKCAKGSEADRQQMCSGCKSVEDKLRLAKSEGKSLGK